MAAAVYSSADRAYRPRVSPHDDDPSDRDAIIARRALLLSTALAALSCSSSGEGTAPPDPPGIAGTSQPSTTTKVRLPAPLPPWAEIAAKIPPRTVPASVDAKERQRLESIEKESETKYQALQALWTSVPSCDPTQPPCRPAWQTASERLKALLDVMRDPLIAPCDTESGRTATVIGRRNAHSQYIQSLMLQFKEHLRATATAFGPLAEQQWQKLEADALKPPPMPCLSPCPLPEVQSILDTFLFAKNVATLDGNDPMVKLRIETIVKLFQSNRAKSKIVVRGHAEATEDNPVELAAQRAKSVTELLVLAGVSKGLAVTKSFGADLPLAHPTEADVLSENRRVDFETVPQ